MSPKDEKMNKSRFFIGAASVALCVGASVHAKDIKFKGAIKGDLIAIDFVSDGDYKDCAASAEYSGKINGTQATAKLECTGSVFKGKGEICNGMHKMTSPKVTSATGKCD